MIESLIVFGSMAILLWVLYRMDRACTQRKPLRLGWLDFKADSNEQVADVRKRPPELQGRRGPRA